MPDYIANPAAVVPRKPTPKPAPPPSTHYYMEDLPRPDARGNICESICTICKKTFRGMYRGMPEQKVRSHVMNVHKIADPRRTWRKP